MFYDFGSLGRGSVVKLSEIQLAEHLYDKHGRLLYWPVFRNNQQMMVCLFDIGQGFRVVAMDAFEEAEMLYTHLKHHDPAELDWAVLEVKDRILQSRLASLADLP